MKVFLNLFVLFCLVTLFGCAGSAEIGAEKTVEKSGSTPDWVLTPTTEQSDFIYVSGELSKGKDRSFAMNQAYADGIRKLMNMMQNAVKTQSSSALRGSNMEDGDVGRFSEFAVAWISDTYKFAGVQNPESYWEKVEVKTATGVNYYYNCYSHLRISKVDYKKALEGAFNEMKKKAQDENNKKAEETAKNLIDELNKK
jgi:hypothetical protein